ncbi:hypothetical protein [Microbacterium album]|uniref:hypothetical protein n=1 Tax=Microbacterium album TaxID=2053191 RepID=UPI001665B84B|nr:hypothetical protein [Microbacterium album]
MDFKATYERKPTPDDEGSDWLYRDPTTKRTHRVEIDVVPDQARKIRIQHLDRDMRGKSEWVPIGRAKVPWAVADDYLATVAMWARAERHRPGAAKSDLAARLLAVYVDERVAGIYYNGASGIIEIHDVPELARLCGLPPEALVEHEDTFTDGATYAPWPTTELVVKRLVARDPQPASEHLASLRADDLRSAKRTMMDGDPWWVSPTWDDDPTAQRLRQWNEQDATTRKYLSQLLDDETPGLAEDFLTLRQMYLDLVRLMPHATERIRMTRARISEALAEEIERLVARPLPPSAALLGADEPTEKDRSI